MLIIQFYKTITSIFNTNAGFQWKVERPFVDRLIVHLNRLGFWYCTPPQNITRLNIDDN